MVKEIVVPDIGEKIESGLVVGVLVKVGDMIDVDQPVIEVETDKAVVEIPSTEKGKVVELAVKEDDEIKPGQVIAKIEVGGKAEKSKDIAKPVPEEKAKKEPEPEEKPEIESEKPEETETIETPQSKPEPEPSAPSVAEEKPGKPAPAAPSVRRLARELGADINKIKGSGPGGRISADDVKQHVKSVMTGKTKAAPVSGKELSLPDFGQWGDIKREKLSKVRSITAENMSISWNVVPQVTQFDKADITAVEEFRREYGPTVEKMGGKLTATTIIMKVIVSALQRFPRFNASLDMEQGEIVYKNYYHLAVAVDTDRGLLVPVIRDVDKKSISEIAVELTDLAERTRNKKVKLEELEGGTFTISNQGGIGGTDFTPIVYWPQVAILGVSRASIQPKFMDDKFVPRAILPLSLSYDHRIIDGADAARFLRWVVEALEHPLLLNLNS